MTKPEFKPSEVPRASFDGTRVTRVFGAGHRLYYSPWPYQEQKELGDAAEFLLDVMIEAGNDEFCSVPKAVRRNPPRSTPYDGIARLAYYGVIFYGADGWAFTELGFRILQWMLTPREEWDAWQQCGNELYHAFCVTEGVPWTSRCGRHRAMKHREHKGGRPYCKDCNTTTNYPQLMQQHMRMLGHENEWKDLDDPQPCSWCTDDADLGPARVVQTEAGLYVPETAVSSRREIAEDQQYTPQNLLDGRPIAPKKDHEKP